MTDSVGGRRTFRNQETVFMAGAFSLAAVAFGFFFLTTLGMNPDGIVAFLVCAALAFIIWTRWSRQGIFVDDREVEVSGAFTSRRLAWSEIERFDLQRRGRDLVTYVELKDGSSVTARALNGGTGLSAAMVRRARAQVDELNQLLQQWGRT